MWALAPDAPGPLVFCCVDPQSWAASTVRPVPSKSPLNSLWGIPPYGRAPFLVMKKRSGLRGHLGAEEAEVEAGCLGGGRVGTAPHHHHPQHITDEQIEEFARCHPERDSGPGALCSGGSLSRIHARLRGSQGPWAEGRDPLGRLRGRGKRSRGVWGGRDC